MPNVKVNKSSFYYELHGKGEPLVLIAGYACDISQWVRTLPLFANHFNVLIFDNRGAGRSESPDLPYTVEEMAEDLIGVLDAAKFGRCHVLGHSLGGSIAQQLAFTHPDRVDKLVIANSSAKFSPISTMVCNFFVKLRNLGITDENILEGMAPWLFSAPFLQGGENVAKMIDLSMRNPHHQSLVGQRRQLQALMNFDAREKIHKISAQTLLIGGEEDLLCAPKELFALANSIPRSQLFLFENQAHMTLIERPDEFAQVAIDFLKRRD
ncbi:MAG: alpha/beta fold hydrolase [Chlamydiales bacterium]|nr:alpha/beta fold hydrolase [Chlamydiales bacterium]